MCDDFDYTKISLEEGISNVPESIYKYRKWDDKYQKTILSERIVFMAPPSSFEDKKDCKIIKRFDLMTEEDIFNKYVSMSKRKNPSWTISQHKEHAAEWTVKSPMKDPLHIKATQDHYFQEFDKRFGVLSLTAIPSNYQMWTKYSDNGKGFCVGFNSLELFKFLGGGGKVNYCNKLPDIFHDDSMEVEHFKQVFSKEMKWKFEEEYRTYKFYREPASIKDRQIKIPSSAFKEVIFGWNTSKENVEEIMQSCANQNLNIKFKKIYLEDEKIGIVNF